MADNKVFTFKKKGNYFTAFNEDNQPMGSINIETEKFVGATFCILQLNEALKSFKRDRRNKNKPKFYQAVLKPVKNIVEHCYPFAPNTTIAERMGDENATCPECGKNHWILLPHEGVAVREGGKPYMECMGCGYMTHF